ncbi:MAG TPA: hypothetical protein VMW04_00805 [Patescibacteria group bacterium]|nr:hypothetical protein [Patescibacteria group bacterium]
MPKQVVSDVFETLGGVAQSTGQQAATQVKKMGGDILESLGVKTSTPAPAQGDGSQPTTTPSPEQLQKMNAEAKVKAAAGLQKVQADIKAIQEKRKKEIPKQVSGKPGFDEGKMVKQLETGKKEKEELPPIVRKEKTKIERLRGVSG